MASGSKARARRPRSPIHPSIKHRLGYELDQSDAEIFKDWRARLSRVCKPCWELKYCPYGPLVEQSPLLPAERSGMVEHVNYLKNCLDTGLVGTVGPLEAERRSYLEEWLHDEEILSWQAHHEMVEERRNARIAKSEDPGEAFDREFSPELPPIHEYRVNYNVLPDSFDRASLSSRDKEALKRKIEERKKAIAKALRDGIEDTRRPLDPGRRASFENTVQAFNPDDYPEEIPSAFTAGQCSVFGHICPVFFAAEGLTETSTERRRGRYISFAVKMRVVRRDNYTCQHCGAHLHDNEVEFDHIIPISKGGSSEEHNIRLTCFDCNRDKSDDYVP